MEKLKFQTPTGMHDILPEEQKYFQKIYNICENIANFYGFEKIETPILEETELFSKGTGVNTDIVQKEMLTLRTKGGDYLTLRPEFTPGIMRAYIQHGMFNLSQPVKLWYFGPCFRYEKPQAGRYRQFWQFGFEILGEKSPVLDVQIIQIFYNILQELRFKNLTIEINSIGDSQCRPYYKKLLVNYLRNREAALCPDCKRRLRQNPLRVLDCKQEKCQPIKTQAPQFLDHLCEDCHRHFKEVLEFLDELELPYNLNPFLVRGLDYYTKTVFEIEEESSEGKILGSLAGGGRYDALSKVLGKREIPAVGGAAGIERVIELMKKTSIKPSRAQKTEIFFAQLGDLAKKKGLKLIEEFRNAKIPIRESLNRDSLKSQLKIANRLGAKYSLILGQKEALEETILIRDMISGKQETVKLEKAVPEIKKRLKKLK